jgi:hypothetical protein
MFLRFNRFALPARIFLTDLSISPYERRPLNAEACNVKLKIKKQDC